MYSLLEGVTVVEASSFVAAPLAGLYLSQLGAEVIRVDQTGGGLDYNRWPKSAADKSFYWEGLNRGKKSVALNLRTAEGRELLKELAAASGSGRGLLLTNFPKAGFLSYDALRCKREDIIVIRIAGHADGTPAFDYTVNTSIGLPYITGPPSLGQEPVNHALPVWDLLSGGYASFALLAAERHRGRSGCGQEVLVPLSDIAISSIANLGQLAEALQAGRNRERLGNEIYGAFGRDFITGDNKRVMIAAITAKQWRSLVTALDIEAEVAALEQERNVSFARDEGIRFEHRHKLYEVVENSVATRDYGALADTFNAVGVCWGPYNTVLDAAQDDKLVRSNPLFTDMANRSGLTYPTPGAAATIPNLERLPPRCSPALGEHSEEVLTEMLSFSGSQISDYVDKGIVGVAD